MTKIGFSTGALAFGDFVRGIELQRRVGINAIELSALRERELPELVARLDSVDLSSFAYRSFHTPSSLGAMTCEELVERLQPVANAKIPIIVHPDIIGDNFTPWRNLGDVLLLENMDSRKPVCRTPSEMRHFLKMLPDAQFCFDIGHARQVDPTMSLAVAFLLEFRPRLAQLHISEVNWQCEHRSIGSLAAMAFHRVAKLIPDSVPVIIESVIDESEIDDELRIVRQCLDWRTPMFHDLQRQTDRVEA